LCGAPRQVHAADLSKLDICKTSGEPSFRQKPVGGVGSRTLVDASLGQQRWLDRHHRW
jgi:hypothetical protein